MWGRGFAWRGISGRKPGKVLHLLRLRGGKCNLFPCQSSLEQEPAGIFGADVPPWLPPEEEEEEEEEEQEEEGHCTNLFPSSGVGLLEAPLMSSADAVLPEMKTLSARLARTDRQPDKPASGSSRDGRPEKAKRAREKPRNFEGLPCRGFIRSRCEGAESGSLTFGGVRV
ncbi:hypothetical protein SKAU_G00356530 [Synaphobranchus kaupii]|uniref:Uncharacterized protein n=1 Tax=Synaphobranchus kaupii TaxID=118154 RepID=A0A9Q1IGH0_SYNKA|nr:hypothetical protein SKAU_G00356530 [Synaphobranchus kaupii]